MGGNGRCKFHGGFLGITPKLPPEERKAHLTQKEILDQTQMAKYRHGLYSAALQQVFRKAHHQILYGDDSTAKLDLTPEIRLWRTKIYMWEEQMANGHTLMETDRGSFVELSEIVYKATSVLTRLIEAQKKLHPDADANGELTVKLVLEDAQQQKQVDELDMPDLEANTTHLVESPPKGEPVPATVNDALAEFMEDDD